MDFNLPEETRMLKDMLRRFVDNELIPLEQKLLDRPNTFELPEDIYQELSGKVKDMGLWAWGAPEEIGGAGLSPLDGCAVIEEVYRSTVGRSVFAPRFAPVLYELGTQAQKEKYLIPFVNGDINGATAFSEPQAAGDLAGIKTTLEETDGGWVINGNKCWISFAKTADFILILTRVKGTERHQGMTWVVLDKGTPGLTIGREQKMIHGLSTYELFLDNCTISREQVLGEPGQGWGAGNTFLYNGRMEIAARGLGVADRCQEMAIGYAKERHTFGKPLSSRQAIQWMLADSAMEIHATRMMVYDAAWRATNGEDVQQQTAMIKVFSSEMTGRVVDRAVQIHGAAGLSDETILELCYRDARPMRIYEGPSEAMRSLVARGLLQ